MSWILLALVTVWAATEVIRLVSNIRGSIRHRKDFYERHR